MRRGSLCNSGGRHWTSRASQPLIRRRAAISCARAPQAMIRAPGAEAVTNLVSYLMRARSRAPCLQQRLGGLHGDGRIAAVGIGADGLAEFLVQRRAAHQHDEIVAD